MDFNKLVTEARSCRRFDEQDPLSFDQVASLVDVARLVPCTANRQPLRYAISVSRKQNEIIFQHLRWAAMLKEWGGPMPGERPSAYIVIGADEEVLKNSQVDLGIAAQTIQLGATAMGFGCCMFSSINAKALHDTVKFPSNVKVVLVLALGMPAEKRVVEAMGPEQSTAYWRDSDNVHHVPKRSLNEVLLVSFREDV